MPILNIIGNLFYLVIVIVLTTAAVGYLPIKKTKYTKIYAVITVILVFLVVYLINR